MIILILLNTYVNAKLIRIKLEIVVEKYWKPEDVNIGFEVMKC